MRNIETPAIVYKITKYMDSSAICTAFTPEHGKIKLFMSKAFTKKGGIMRFTPGNLVYSSKETTDLNKFVTFAHSPDYYHYHQNPDIICRLHLLFDFFDHMFETGQQSNIFWKLLLKYNIDNFKELSVYTLYRMFKDSGLMFDTFCAVCGEFGSDMVFVDNSLVCISCCGSVKIDIKKETMLILNQMNDSSLYKDVKLSGKEELSIIDVFNRHLNILSNSKEILKSFEIFKTMVF